MFNVLLAEQARDDVTKLMLEDIRKNTNKENSDRANLFESELENTRKHLQKTAITSSAENPNEEDILFDDSVVGPRLFIFLDAIISMCL